MLQLCLPGSLSSSNSQARCNARTCAPPGATATQHCPRLYISHGAPPLFEDAAWIDELSRWADALPVPACDPDRIGPLGGRAWEPQRRLYRPTSSTTSAGFDPRYYRMRYDTPEATGLAAEVLATRTGRMERTSAHEPRSRPWRLGAAEGDVPGGQRAGPAAEPAHARPRPPAATRQPSEVPAGPGAFSSSARDS